MIGLQPGSLEAFQIDTATALYGTFKDNGGEVNNGSRAAKKAKTPASEFASWGGVMQTPQRGKTVKKMAVPDSGIW